MAVSQAPVISEVSAAVAPPVAVGTVASLPSAVQDLAMFFLSLAGSSSLVAVGGVAGAAVPASGVGAQLCPSAPGGGAVAFLCCDCGSCCGDRLNCCFRCCARFVRPSAASGGLPLQQASTSLIQRWDWSCEEEASSGSFPFPWSFFSPPGGVLSVIFQFF